jgi:hypothetical protein
MPHRIRPEDRIHVAELRERPHGRHSPGLQRILNVMRGTPLEGRYVLVCTRPFREWRLGRHPGARGRRIEIVEGHVFRSREEAEWAVFRLRWKELAGEELS